MKRLTKPEGIRVSLPAEDYEALWRMAYSAKELAEWAAALPGDALHKHNDERHHACEAVNEIEDAVEYLDGGEFPWD